MKVARGKTFQNENGVWEKIEIELDTSDLLPDELAASEQVQAQLLEARIDKHLIMHLYRHNQLTKDEATEQIAANDAHRAALLKVRPKTLLKRRGVTNDE